MKYISKGIGSHGQNNWSPEEWVYQALAWKHHHRYIGMSRTLSRYCTAYKLRYRYRKNIRNLTNGADDPGLPPLPTNTINLNEIIQMFQCQTSPGRRTKDSPPNQKWSCTFTRSRFGNIALIRKCGTITTDLATWINRCLSTMVGHNHNVLPNGLYGLIDHMPPEYAKPRNSQQIPLG